MGNQIFMKLLNKDGNFILNKSLWEGTQADLLIKMKNSKDDLWYAIQMKTCSGFTNGTYDFRDTEKYDGLIIICICLENEKIWMVPGADAVGKTKICIGKKGMGYGKYFVKNEECINKLKFYINTLKLHYKSFEKWDVPKSDNQKTERDYYYLHYPYFKKYKLERPEIEHTSVDSFVMVNGIMIRFQNKVSGTIRNGALGGLNFRKKGGYVNKKVTYKPYKYDEFDCLFVHINNEKYKKFIYLIPMPEIVKKTQSVVYKDIKVKSTFILNLFSKPNLFNNKKNKWDRNNYLFNLENNDDIIRINILLEKMAKYKKKDYIEDFPVVDNAYEYYGPHTLQDYLNNIKQLKTLPKDGFKTHSQFKNFLRKDENKDKVYYITPLNVKRYNSNYNWDKIKKELNNHIKLNLT